MGVTLVTPPAYDVKCDRCGTSTDAAVPNPPDWQPLVLISPRTPMQGKQLMMCPSCAAALNTFLSTKPETSTDTPKAMLGS